MDKKEEHFSPPNPLLIGGRGWKIDPWRVKWTYDFLNEELDELEDFYKNITPTEYQKEILGEFCGKEERK